MNPFNLIKNGDLSDLINFVHLHEGSMKERDSKNRTLLHVAVLEEKFSMVRWLIHENIDTNLRDNEEYTAIERAIHKNNTEIAKLLLISPGTNVKSNRHGYTYLHAAAAHGNNELVELLVSMGLCVNEKDDEGNGFTPLHWAVQQNHTKTVELLLKYGADPNIKDSEGFFALYMASSNGYLDMIKLLLLYKANIHMICEASSNSTSLLIATAYDQFGAVQLLLDNGANINDQGSDGRTSLHIAAFHKYLELYHYLLDRGADSSIKDQRNLKAKDYLYIQEDELED
ncbi:hypothetical protein F4V43_16535 [Paenibacillus spiritus]|uniref:Uncharacterized protein n=1 Tax=Paenibacillus spiritus TaxID=2496557 RepID=A0A5J5FX24_9BACL|nr:ankyrin repeat domain-containing protein [Paenibacillus spiritus]KAA8998359.1 hypothetical protein F4V43_16535 [Paenibacillus spiritus]